MNTESGIVTLLIELRFEFFTAVTIKYAVFWDNMPCGSYENLRSSETSLLTIATRPHYPEDGILNTN
jgi:hypothetical protein